MITVRELIMALAMNCDLDDKVEVEVKIPGDETSGCDFNTFKSVAPRRIYHMANGEALIECHDD